MGVTMSWKTWTIFARNTRVWGHRQTNLGSYEMGHRGSCRVKSTTNFKHCPNYGLDKVCASWVSELISCWWQISQCLKASFERKLDDFLQEFRERKRQGSVISTQTKNSLCMNEREAWRILWKELEEIGITVAAFDTNKNFIFYLFTEANANGAFEERPLDDSPTAEPCGDSLDKRSKGNFNFLAIWLGSQ